VGIPHKDSPIWFATLHTLLDREQENSGGIFDSRRAKELERFSYRKKMEIYLKLISRNPGLDPSVALGRSIRLLLEMLVDGEENL